MRLPWTLACMQEIIRCLLAPAFAPTTQLTHTACCSYEVQNSKPRRLKRRFRESESLRKAVTCSEALKAAYLANAEIIDNLRNARAAILEEYSRVEDVLIRYRFDFEAVWFHYRDYIRASDPFHVLDSAQAVPPKYRKQDRHPILYKNEVENLRFAQLFWIKILITRLQDLLVRFCGSVFMTGMPYRSFSQPDSWMQAMTHHRMKTGMRTCGTWNTRMWMRAWRLTSSTHAVMKMSNWRVWTSFFMHARISGMILWTATMKGLAPIIPFPTITTTVSLIMP